MTSTQYYEGLEPTPDFMMTSSEHVALSQAISLKRIADALSPPDADATRMNISAILYEMMQNGVPR